MNSSRAFIASSVLLAGSLPFAILLAPSFLSKPFDVVVSLALPYHMFHGTKNVIYDYTPKQFKAPALQAWAAIAAVSGFGLLKLGICGPGIGASIKSLWVPAKVKKTIKKDQRRD